MASPKHTKILIYGSTTSGNVPLAANLETSVEGVELAVNAADGKLFFKTPAGDIVMLANVATANPASIAVTGGTINGVVIGGTVAAAGSFTTLSASQSLALAASTTLSLSGSVGTAGQVLTSAGVGATPTWATPVTGTVTSVAISVPAFLSVANSPVTSAGTLALTLSGLALPISSGGTGAVTAGAALTSLGAQAALVSGTSIKTINATSLLGAGNITIVENAVHTGDVTGGTALTIANKVTMTASGPLALTGAPTVIAGGAVNLSMAAASSSVNGYLASADFAIFAAKQAALVSATNIKTINGVSILGAGDLATPQGTITSVAMTVPTGLTVAGSPLTGAGGTLAVTLTTGYSIPTTASQATWDTAYADRNNWDGGVTGLVAATGRSSLGLGTAAVLNVAAAGNASAPEVVKGNDTRLTDARIANGGNAATVTTNANLTGVVTSVGNATSIANGAITNAMLANAGIATNVSGTVAIANGGTGATTAAAALNALLPTQTGQAGNMLVTDGTNTSWVVPSSTSYTRTTLAPTPGTTTANVSYTVGYVNVFLNGLFLSVTDYTATDGTTMTFSVAFEASDVLDVITYGLAPVGVAGGIAGGVAGSIPYQTASNATSLLAPGSTGKVLYAGTTPAWIVPTISPVTAVTTDLDLSTGGFFTKTITAPTTLTLSNVPAAGLGCRFLLDIINGGAFPTTFWSGLKWAGGTPPTLTVSGRDSLEFYIHSGTSVGRAFALDAK